MLEPIPEGYYTITPWIISKNSDGLATFIKKVFGGKEKGRVVNDDGSVGHLEIQIGNSIVMLFDSKQGWPETPSFMRLYVEDGENVINLAKEAGANVVTKLTYLFFGESGANPRSMGQHLVDSATSERGWFVRTRKANA